MQEVEDFIDDLPDEERRIARRLRTLILDAEPRIVAKLSYGVPYFSRYRRLFFIWPASHPGIRKHIKRPLPKVTMGFCYGDLLSKHQGLLMRDGRKQVYTIELSSAADINKKRLSEIIAEAIIVDKEFFGKQTR